MFKYKTLLKWKEPKNALKAYKNQLTWQIIVASFALRAAKFGFGGFIVGLIFVIYVAFTSNREFQIDQNLAFLLLFSLFGLGFGFISWVQGFADGSKPRTIHFGEEHIQIHHFNGGYYQASYQDFQGYNINKADFNDVECRILELKDRRGAEFKIEIDQNIKSEDISEVFKSKNVQMKPSLLNQI